MGGKITQRGLCHWETCPLLGGAEGSVTAKASQVRTAVESAIACDCRNARRSARGSPWMGGLG